MLRLPDCIGDRFRLGVPQPAEWQHIGDETKADDLCGDGLRKCALAPGLCIRPPKPISTCAEELVSWYSPQGETPLAPASSRGYLSSAVVLAKPEQSSPD